MADRKQDPRGSGPPKPSAKKNGHPKPPSHTKGAKSSASHPKKDKKSVPFQPVLLRPQEPRAKPVEAISATPSVEQGPKPQNSPKNLQPRSPTSIDVSSSLPASNVRIKPKASSHLEKTTQTCGSEPKGSLESGVTSNPPSSVSPRANTSSVPNLTTEPMVSTRPAGQINANKQLAPTYSLLSELTQFQVILTEELKSFLDQTQEYFPTSTNSSNTLTQGEVVVIGVLGGRNTGKSTLLNAIAQQAEPLLPTPRHPMAQEHSTPKPLSILQQLAELNAKTQISTSPPSFAPFTVKSPQAGLKTVSSIHDNFHVEMAIVRKPNHRVFEMTNNFDLQQRVNASDCFILLEFQCFHTASMLMQGRKGDNMTGDIRNQEIGLELLSLQIGVFAASICNVLISVDDCTSHMARWKYWKTVEMLKWGIPEISELYHKAPSIPNLIPQLKRSFFDARVSATYEKMMTDLAAKASKKTEQVKVTSSPASYVAHPSQPSRSTNSSDPRNKSKSKQGKKSDRDVPGRGNSARSASPSESSALVTEMTRPSSRTMEEQHLKEIDRAIASTNLYSPEHEYLPSLMFAFNKSSVLTSDMRHQMRVQTALTAFFANSAFLQPQSIKPDSSSSQKIVHTIPFAMTPLIEDKEVNGEGNHSKFEEFVSMVLQLPRPKFRKPLNPREWIVSAIWVWEIIKQSPAMAQYQNALKQSSISARSAGS